MLRIALYNVFVILFFIVALFFLSSHGKDSRKFAGTIVTFGQGIPETVLVENQREVYSIWKQRNVYGRVVLHFDTFMDIKPLDENSQDILFGRLSDWGLSSSSVEVKMSNENFMLFAITNGTVRKLIGILPEVVYLEGNFYKQEGDSLHSTHYFPFSKYYRGTVRGSPKIVTILKNLPAITEPVLFNFDSLFFSSPDVIPEEIYDELKKLNIKTDLITFSLSSNDKGVTLEGIEKMRRFMKLLGAV